jgi:hypothetical protein
VVRVPVSMTQRRRRSADQSQGRSSNGLVEVVGDDVDGAALPGGDVGELSAAAILEGEKGCCPHQLEQDSISSWPSTL